MGKYAVTSIFLLLLLLVFVYTAVVFTSQRPMVVNQTPGVEGYGYSACGSGYIEIINSTNSYCVPYKSETVVTGGEIRSFSANSTFLVSNLSVEPFSFYTLNGHIILPIWTAKTSVPSGLYSFLSIPDTFKIHMQYFSNVSTEFIVMSNSQYVNWVNDQNPVNSAIDWLLSAIGVYKQQPYPLLENGKNISVWFNQSSGCAGYVAVILSGSSKSFSITPNETAMYDPSPFPTGECAYLPT
ncbi:hypothetical protein M1293_03935 [Candidatus Parvarchaeota archaeon]|nr:hypothetical protein [Candidatus Parvarchaeota archaeon]